MKIFILSPYPFNTSPSQRFRFEQYLDILNEQGFLYEMSSFYSINAWRCLYKKGYVLRKLGHVLLGFIRQFTALVNASNADIVFIHREITPFGPPFFEWVIAKVFRKKIIYDFDDAIWLTDLGSKDSLKIFLKNPSKVNSIIKWSWKVSCGNAYLKEHALKYNKNAILNPTTVDTIHKHNKIKNQRTEKVVVGWTGSHSTLVYLAPLIPLLKRVYKECPFEFIIICNRPLPEMPHFAKFILWKEETEVEDLLRMNIGLMPLIDDEWTNGKCGFKAIQYMSLGIPALVSPVGVNSVIVDHEVNGYHCSDEEQWASALLKLLKDESLRSLMGESARVKIINNYSLESNKQNFLSLFNK